MLKQKILISGAGIVGLVLARQFKKFNILSSRSEGSVAILNLPIY